MYHVMGPDTFDEMSEVLKDGEQITVDMLFFDLVQNG